MNNSLQEKVFSSYTKKRPIHEAVLYIESNDSSYSADFCYGNRTIDTPMIAASITKMFTTACILRFCDDGLISLSDNLTKYFTSKQLSGLHVYKGHEYSFDMQISNLLFHTTGLPDSFEAGDISAILSSDIYTSFEGMLQVTKEQKPHFAPSTDQKAYYANINFDMLGEILTKVSGLSLSDVYIKYIFAPLGMIHTYVQDQDNPNIPNIYYGDKCLIRPKTIASGPASGGCISTPRDLMLFSKAFWNGKLFNKDVFSKLAVYRKVQSTKGPIRYGGGYMQLGLGGPSTSFMGKGELIGHFGSTGSFMFYYPEKDVHYVGDLAQFKYQPLSFRLLLRLAMLKE